MTARTPYDMFIAAGYFAELDTAFHLRPDCKTAQRVVRRLWATETLRFEQKHTPLNIRIVEKKGRLRQCVLTTLILLAVFMVGYPTLKSFMSLAGLPWDGFTTSPASQQTTVEFDYYPPEVE